MDFGFWITKTLSGSQSKIENLKSKIPAGALLLLDEPTTGLHRHDVKRLLAVLQRIVDRGHSAVVIEHNLDVIRSADWVIDLGPEGGAQGGKVVAQGPPETVEGVRASHTGRFLREHRDGRTHAKLA